MRNLFIILSFISASNTLISQIEVKPICDEVMEIPYTFSYSGFIIQDNVGQVDNNDFQIKIEITEDSPAGNLLLSEIHFSPFQKNGFFNVNIGSARPNEFEDVIMSMNENPTKDYYIVVSLRTSGWQYNQIGSKLIQTVPYAMVANSIGGIGERGDPGEDGLITGPVGPEGPSGAAGPNGATGLSGPTGDQGINGFPVLIMRSTPPTSLNEKFYVDDGTNTEDGKPHLRYRSNGNWIDLK